MRINPAHIRDRSVIVADRHIVTPLRRDAFLPLAIGDWKFADSKWLDTIVGSASPTAGALRTVDGAARVGALGTAAGGVGATV